MKYVIRAWVKPEGAKRGKAFADSLPLQSGKRSTIDEFIQLVYTNMPAGALVKFKEHRIN